MKSPPLRAKKGRLTYTLICGERIAHMKRAISSGMALFICGNFRPKVSNAEIFEISLMRRFSVGSYERPCNAEILRSFCNADVRKSQCGILQILQCGIFAMRLYDYRQCGKIRRRKNGEGN